MRHLCLYMGHVKRERHGKTRRGQGVQASHRPRDLSLGDPRRWEFGWFLGFDITSCKDIHDLSSSATSLWSHCRRSSWSSSSVPDPELQGWRPRRRAAAAGAFEAAAALQKQGIDAARLVARLGIVYNILVRGLAAVGSPR